MELDLSDPEPSVLEYARLHGLARDYRADGPLLNAVVAPSDHDLNKAFNDFPDTPLTNPADGLVRERLTVCKDGVSLLKDIFSLQAMPEHDVCLHGSWKRTSHLKLEVPLLYTDNDTDLQEFGNTSVPSSRDVRLPLEIVDDEKDEGLGWPSTYLEYPKMYAAKCQSEKLRVSKDVLVYLQNAIRDEWSRLDLENLKCGEELRKRKTQRLTPPLLTNSPPLTPYIPSSPGNRLDLLSESSNSTGVELKLLEDQIMKDDSLIPALNSDASDDSLLLDVFVPLGHVQEEPLTVPTKRKVSDLKVEGPLTPLNSDSPVKRLKSVSFKDLVCEYIPNVPPASDVENGNHDDSDTFAEIHTELEAFAKEATRQLECEKLCEVDTTKRVDVPHVDFITPLAPWDVFSRKVVARGSSSDWTELDAQRRFLTQVKRSDLKTAVTWHGVSKLDRELTWAVFPKEMGSITLEEDLHGGEIVNKVLAELTEDAVATSSTDIWHRDGLRILEDEDSEDELEPADCAASNTSNCTIQLVGFGNSNQGTLLDSHPGYRQKPDNKIVPQASLGTKLDGNSLLFGGRFSASNALQRYMELHGKSSEAPAVAQQTTLPEPMPAASHASGKNAYVGELPQRISQEHHVSGDPNPPANQQQVPLHLPEIPHSLPTCSYIMSVTLLRQRALFREIQKLYPSAHIIERDFALPHSPNEEADLLLSPSTGLICTTLQQIKQRSLPGQPERSPIKERLLALQARYERLIVLISEGLSLEAESLGSSRAMEASDMSALAQLDDFASKMDAELFTVFVPGGERVLARAIVNEMVRWGLPHGSKDLGDLKLLEDETTWEVFLRRAGLNPYAVQVILASFKNPFDLPLVASSPYDVGSSQPVLKVYGLPAFVLLEAEERIARFEVLLGGRRVLGRVNAMLDRKWPSAANGFAM